MINYNVEYLFKILELAIHNKTIELPQKEIDWNFIGRIACENSILPIIYTKIAELPESYLPQSEVMLFWKSISFKMGMKQMVSFGEFKKVIEKARENNISLIPFKGAALAQLYPRYFERYSCDFDILAKKNERPYVHKMLVEMGYECDDYKEMVPVYRIPDKVKLEIHFSLYEDYEGSQIDLLNKMQLDNPKKYVPIDLKSVQFNTLGYDEHLIYQFFHIIKHFSFEGISLKYLTDIVLYVEHYHDKMDWNNVWERLRELQYDKFAKIIFFVASKYLGLKYVLFDESEIEKKNVDDFLEETLQSKKEGHIKWGTVRMLEPYLFRNATIEMQDQIKWSMMFPKAENMPERYAYARKYKILLPYAWLERIVRHMYWKTIKKRSNTASDTINEATHKLVVLQDMGIVNSKK